MGRKDASAKQTDVDQRRQKMGEHDAHRHRKVVSEIRDHAAEKHSPTRYRVILLIEPFTNYLEGFCFIFNRIFSWVV